MRRKDATTIVKDAWRDILPQLANEAKRKVNGETSYICPFCGHGKGGDGLTYDPKSKDRNSLKCFNCGFSGSVIDFYMQLKDKDFIEATDDLAAMININIDDKATERPQPAQLPPADYTNYYKQCAALLTDPDKGKAAREYINHRGISTETATAFNFGFDPVADPANAPGNTDGKIYPTPRIIAPCNKSFYIARAIDPKAEYKAPMPKGSTADIFNANALYNSNIVFVVEGLFDALSFIEAGHQAIALNAVGFGSKLIKHLTEKPAETSFIICPDNDADAKTDKSTKAQMQALKEELNSIGYSAIIYNIAGDHHDANDAFILDPAGFNKRIAAAIKEIETPGDDLALFLEKIQTETYKPHATGISFLDKLFNGGIENQTLNFLMAAPATGKTALCSQLAEAIARNDRPVIYFNFEMSREQMLARVISARLLKHGGYKMTSKQIRQGYKWNDEEKAIVTAEVEAYSREARPRYVDANEIKPQLNNIREYLEKIGEAAIAKGEQAPAVFVDYLHLINEKGLDAQATIKECCQMLKDYAIVYKTYCFAILASNRVSMTKAKKGKKGARMTLYSGRDSSGIEYSGDIFISLDFKVIEDGDIDAEIPEELESYKLLHSKWEMVLRQLKDRSDGQAPAQTVLFDPASMTFYAADNTSAADNITTYI